MTTYWIFDDPVDYLFLVGIYKLEEVNGLVWTITIYYVEDLPLPESWTCSSCMRNMTQKLLSYKKIKKKWKFAFISFRTALFLIAYSSRSVETPIVLIEVLLVVQCNSEPVIINVETMTRNYDCMLNKKRLEN